MSAQPEEKDWIPDEFLTKEIEALLNEEADNYKKMAALARSQLASIDARLSSQGGWWNEYLFKFRHARLKKMLRDTLRHKESRTGKHAILELIEELKGIGEDEDGWGDVKKEETDYIRFVLHGIKQSPPSDSSAKQE